MKSNKALHGISSACLLTGLSAKTSGYLRNIEIMLSKRPIDFTLQIIHLREMIHFPAGALKTGVNLFLYLILV